MKLISILVLLLSPLLLPGCAAGGMSRAVPGQSLTLSYDDFGPERIAAPFLGPRGPRTVIIAHYGFSQITPSASEDVRYVNVLQSMNFLRDQVRHLPLTAANEPLRQRLRSTYARLYPLQLTRYNIALGSSYTIPFGGMDRRLMLPTLPPPSI